MQSGRRSDFYFVGVVVLPLVLLLAGELGLALLSFFPLLFAGCLAGMDEQVRGEADENRGSGESVRPGKPAAAEGLALRSRQGRR